MRAAWLVPGLALLALAMAGLDEDAGVVRWQATVSVTPAARRAHALVIAAI